MGTVTLSETHGLQPAVNFGDSPFYSLQGTLSGCVVGPHQLTMSAKIWQGVIYYDAVGVALAGVGADGYHKSKKALSDEVTGLGSVTTNATGAVNGATYCRASPPTGADHALYRYFTKGEGNSAGCPAHADDATHTGNWSGSVSIP